MRGYHLAIDKYHTPQDIAYYTANTAAKGVISELSKAQGDDITMTKEKAATLPAFNEELYQYTTEVVSKRMGSYHIQSETDSLLNVTVFHNTTAFQAAPTFLHAISEAAVNSIWHTKYPKKTVNFTSKSYNWPLPLTKQQDSLFKNANTMTATMIFALGMAFIPTGLITFIVKERESNVKHQHLVSGVSIPAYWLSSYLWDFTKFLVPGIICPLLIDAFNLESLTSSSEKYSCTWSLFLLFGVSIPVYTYCCSFLFKNYSTAQFTIFMFNLVMGTIVPLIIWVLRLINASTRDVADSLMWPARLSPIFCFAFGIMNLANIETYKVAYGITRDLSPFDWRIAGADLTCLVLIAGFSLFALFLIEYLKNIQWIQNVAAARDPGPNTYRRDNNVEDMKTAAALADPKEVAVKVAGLRKVYGSLFSQVKVAVQEVSFTVPYQECFALLGVNGAGKTSVFRILTGEYSATEGDAFINGHSCVSEISKARYNIGYCPQFDALSELLTSREHLRLYARIKGIPSRLITQFVERQLDDMGLRKYERTRAGNLSGGNKRKLAVAMATIGNPPVIFLDEPSAGMDPEARKNMWRVINRLKSQRCSIILTTHSMDEAEALCNTIGIMVAGRFRCYGTATQIKNTYSKGYEIQLKVLSPTLEEIQEKMLRVAQFVQDHSVQSAVVSQVLRTLGCEYLNSEIDEEGSGSHIKRELDESRRVESRTLLEWVCIEAEGAAVENWLECTFHRTALLEHHGAQFTFNVEVSPGQSIGSIFGLIEEYRTQLKIGDYSVSQTTLEQIFNMFATELPLDRASARLSRSQVFPVN